jgi:hypothetical protein
MSDDRRDAVYQHGLGIAQDIRAEVAAQGRKRRPDAESSASGLNANVICSVTSGPADTANVPHEHPRRRPEAFRKAPVSLRRRPHRYRFVDSSSRPPLRIDSRLGQGLSLGLASYNGGGPGGGGGGSGVGNAAPGGGLGGGGSRSPRTSGATAADGTTAATGTTTAAAADGTTAAGSTTATRPRVQRGATPDFEIWAEYVADPIMTTGYRDSESLTPLELANGILATDASSSSLRLWRSNKTWMPLSSITSISSTLGESPLESPLFCTDRTAAGHSPSQGPVVVATCLFSNSEFLIR